MSGIAALWRPQATVPPEAIGSMLGAMPHRGPDGVGVWADGDVVSLDFPPSLWTAPLNDYHAWHNATLAFMYGPLVLAGVNVTSDLFVPAGSPHQVLNEARSTAVTMNFVDGSNAEEAASAADEP